MTECAGPQAALISRRRFLAHGGGAALGFLGLQQLLTASAWGADAPPGHEAGFGALVPDPKGLLELPARFTYRILSRTGDVMGDGFHLPGLPDGMAAFSGSDGETIVVRNHEIDHIGAEIGAFGAGLELLARVPEGKIYDRGHGKKPGLGGTTTFVYETRSGRLKRQWLSLAGTHRNCAGGATPWGSWLTCEEALNMPDGEIEQPHGYVFEVPAQASGLVDPLPLTAMGRFNHEAAASDPRSAAIYLTEDRPDGLFYRFLANEPGVLRKGGRLQALALRDRKSADTSNWSGAAIAVGTRLPVSWIDIGGVESPNDDLRRQGRTKGAAAFARGEGLWSGGGAIHMVCTIGGKLRKGQVWRYFPSAVEGQDAEQSDPAFLELFIEPNDAARLDMGDNITVCPWGDLLICEDGPGEKRRNSLMGVTPNGALYRFGRNVFNASEFAGATFSPDGSTLFVNIQSPGVTLAITGPWPS
jgi:uncharacterized protein